MPVLSFIQHDSYLRVIKETKELSYLLVHILVLDVLFVNVRAVDVHHAKGKPYLTNMKRVN